MSEWSTITTNNNPIPHSHPFPTKQQQVNGSSNQWPKSVRTRTLRLPRGWPSLGPCDPWRSSPWGPRHDATERLEGPKEPSGASKGTWDHLGSPGIAEFLRIFWINIRRPRLTQGERIREEEPRTTATATATATAAAATTNTTTTTTTTTTLQLQLQLQLQLYYYILYFIY